MRSSGCGRLTLGASTPFALLPWLAMMHPGSDSRGNFPLMSFEIKKRGERLNSPSKNAGGGLILLSRADLNALTRE